MQGYLGSQPQSERGAIGSVVIAGGVQMKLLAIWFCENRSMAKGALEDRLAHLSICWRWTSRSPKTACGQRWMTEFPGEDSHGGGGGGGATEVDLVVTVVVVVKTFASRSAGLGFDSRLGRELYQRLNKLALQWLPCQAPGVIRSALGLVGLASVYCDWVKKESLIYNF